MGITLEKQNTTYINQEKEKVFTLSLLEWGKNNTRHFPWRENNYTLYAKIVAEVFLQKTNSDQVAFFMPIFLTKFPNAEKILASQLVDIEQALRPLGVFRRRAVTLEVLAKLLVTENPVKVIEWEKLLLRVPGIGDYTRNAFLINGFNVKRIAVDTNFIRLVNRFFGISLKRDPRKDKNVPKIAKKVFPSNKTRDFLFSLLDYCSEICKSKKPECQKCILKELCNYFKLQE